MLKRNACDSGLVTATRTVSRPGGQTAAPLGASMLTNPIGAALGLSICFLVLVLLYEIFSGAEW